LKAGGPPWVPVNVTMRHGAASAAGAAAASHAAPISTIATDNRFMSNSPKPAVLLPGSLFSQQFQQEFVRI
jgi:hypothetical protein